MKSKFLKASVEAAMHRAVRTGNRRDLVRYLRLRRQLVDRRIWAAMHPQQEPTDG